MEWKDFFVGHHDRKRIQFTRASISSLLSALLDYGLLFLLVEVLGFPILTAGTIGMVAGLIFLYIMGRLWIYPPVPDAYIGVEVTFFVLIAVVGMGIHTLILSTGLRLVDIHYFFIKAAASGGMFLWNFIMRRITNSLIRGYHHRREERRGGAAENS